MRQSATISCHTIANCGPDGLPKLLESYGIPITYATRTTITESYYDPVTKKQVGRTYTPMHPGDWHIACAHKINKALMTNTILLVWDKEKPLGTEP